MTDDLDQLLKNLRLHRIREVLERELDKAQNGKKKPSYSEFLATLLREQYYYQRERSVVYRLDKSKLPKDWSLESFPFDRQPGVDQPTIRQLAELHFLSTATNIVFVGGTGVGKSGLAASICARPSRTAIAASLSTPKTFSMTCIRAWPTIRRAAYSTD